MAQEQTPQQPPSGEGPEQTQQGETPTEQQTTEQIPHEAKTMAMLCHLLAIFTSFLGPLIVWLIKKDEYPFVNEQGKEALNFQITVAIGYAISALLLPVFCIGSVTGTVVFICSIVFCIIATIKTNNGEHYRYPVSLRLIK